MNNSFLIDGYWWLPTNPNNRIAGTFNFKTYELSDLKLYGDFDKQDFLSLNANPAVKSPLIIFGEDDKANQITLGVLAYGYRPQPYTYRFSLCRRRR